MMLNRQSLHQQSYNKQALNTYRQGFLDTFLSLISLISSSSITHSSVLFLLKYIPQESFQGNFISISERSLSHIPTHKRQQESLHL